MVEHRYACFQAHTHRSAIDLREYVVGQIAYQVEIHHSVGELREVGPTTRIRHYCRRLRTAYDDRRGLPPVRHKALVNVFWRSHRQNFSQFMKLVSGIGVAPAAG